MTNKRLIAGFMTIFITSLCVQAQITVCTTCTISSIQQGIDLATAYDTVFVEEGVYFEYNIAIGKPLTI